MFFKYEEEEKIRYIVTSLYIFFNISHKTEIKNTKKNNLIQNCIHKHI